MIHKVRSAVALLLMPVAVFAEYQSDSKFSVDYKCLSDTKGGFNHEKYGHDFTKFKGVEEFFITHISNIPIEGIKDYLQYNKAVDGFSDEELREYFEHQKFENTEFGSYGGFEESSYFIRDPETDPKKGYAYWDKCDTYYELEDGEARPDNVFCFVGNSTKSFIFNAKTERFSYSYLGSWHLEQKDPEYYGDSSVFAFGTCKPYYR